MALMPIADLHDLRLVRADRRPDNPQLVLERRDSPRRCRIRNHRHGTEGERAVTLSEPAPLPCTVGNSGRRCFLRQGSTQQKPIWLRWRGRCRGAMVGRKG